MDKNKLYYYNQMDRSEKQVYEAMLSCFRDISPSAPVLRLDGKKMSNVFFRLKLDNPDIFYVTGCVYRGFEQADYIELLPEYMFSKKDILDHKKALSSRLERLIRPAKELSDSEKEKFVHDFICSSVRYDKLKKSYSHELIGPMQNGVGVCEGIAKTVKLMCNSLGLECIIAISEAAEEGGYLHAWNIIHLDNNWYHLDATFDNTLGKGGSTRYDYFNLNDERIFRDHRPLVYPVPRCSNGDKFYYKTAKLSWTKEEDVKNRAVQALKKGRDGMLFHWRGGYLTREKMLELAGLINSVAAQAGKGTAYAVNWPQAVIKLTFTESVSDINIETEHADKEEGEK